MTHKQDLIAKCTLPILLVASFTMLVGCGSSNTGSGSNSTQSNVSASTPSSSTGNSNNTSDAGKSNASGSGTDKQGSTTDSAWGSSTKNNSSNNNSNSNNNSSSSSSNTSSSSSTSISGSNGITTQAPQGKMVAFEAVTDLTSLPSQAKGMVDVHKAENGVFRDDENGTTYILIGSGKSPSAGLTLRAEKVTEDNDKITVTTSEYKPGSTGPAVPYFVIKIKQTSKPVEAYNLGYTK